jgi:hypothetical protein
MIALALLTTAAPPPAPPSQIGQLGTTNLREWMLSNIIPLLLLAVAVLLLWLGGGKGDNAGVARRVVGVLVALGVIGLAVSGAGVNLGTWISGLFAS